MLNKAHGQWTFEYVATNYLIPGLRPNYNHIVDTTISAATVNEKLATVISAGRDMEARKRQRQQRVRACPPNLNNSYKPMDPHHATGPNVVCRRTGPSGGQQRWTNQGGNDGMPRHPQPVGFVSPAGHQNKGHQHANNNSDQRPTGHHEAYPFVGVSPTAQHHSSMPITLTCTTAAPGGAATGAQEGEGEDDPEDDLHEYWQRPQPVPTPAHLLCLTSPTFPAAAALASHVLHAEQGVMRGDPPPTLPLLTAAPILQLPTSRVIDHLFSPCHGPSTSEVEALVEEYGFTIHKITGADPSTEARTMWTHRLHVISNTYPGRLPQSAFQDCHARTPMDVNDITITEMEHLRPGTLIVSGPPCQPWSRAGSRLGWQDHRSRGFASVIGFIRFYLTTQPTPLRYIMENVPDALDFFEILPSLGTGNIMRATACGSTAHRDTLLWTNIAPQPDIQNYVSNINDIELTDPGPCAWDHCLSEFPHFTPVVTTDYFPKFVARPGSYAFRMQTNGQPGAGMVCEHDGPWSWADNGRWREPLPATLRARAMGFTLDALPTSHLSEAALRNLLGGLIDLNVMRDYIKAVSGAATVPPVINVCHTSHGISINSDGEAWVLIDSGASSHVNAHRTDYIYYMDIHAAEQFLHAIGIPKLGPAPEAICPTCIHAKSHQQSVNRQPSPRATAPYVLVVIDDWKGPWPSVTGAQHVFGAMDAHTSVKVAITMRTKDEAVRAIHQLHAAVLGMGHAIQRMRADRSAVYTGSPFRHSCADLNIALEFTASHYHHQAGLAERSFRTIGECAQAMLLHAGLDRTFWDWAYLHAVYLCNRQWSDYHPTLVASAIAEVVRPYSAQMVALALPSPTVRVSKAPRNYKEAISSNHPDDWKPSMDPERTIHAWNLVKALYGLPQAHKAWFLRFSSFLREFGFIISECDPGVWTLLAADGSLLAILCVYVDEIMLATSPSYNIQGRFQTSLFTTFDATTDGLCTWLIGMAIDRKPGGVIHLHQEKYINDILTTFNMTECKPRRLPCTPDTDFHGPTCAPLDTKLFPYPNLVGSLISLVVASRPDIAFVVGRLCAYMASPTERHWQIAISVLRYLKGTPSHGLIFRKQLDNGAPDFIFFVDADRATFVPKCRSTTGYLAKPPHH
eukprot:jgi/Tetstr1/427216/TSEL_017404.t1